MTTPMGEGKVSIVIPCYNHGVMLREALTSVEQVRNANLLEVIIVDDGSSEAETTRILEEVGQAGHSVVAQSNWGLSAARNVGIRLAKGEFILPLDSDNRVRDAYLNEAASLLKDNPSLDVIYADAEYFGERNGHWHVPEFDLSSLIRANFIDACGLYRKSLWEKVGGYDEQMLMGLEDWDFWLRVALHGGSFVHLPQIGFDYRVREDSLSRKMLPHIAEIADYIFAKPGMACYKLIHGTDEEVQQLRAGIRSMQHSLSYRLGRGLLAPARLLRKLWRCFR